VTYRPALALTVGLALFAGCSGTQAIKTARRAELGIGISLAGVLATSLVIAAAPGTKPYSIGVAAGFGGLAVISAVVFGVAYANKPPPPPPPPPPPDRKPEAWAKTQEAQTAARSNDCVRVQQLAAEVQSLDGDFYTVVFARDVAIKSCLTPSTP
jgi:hypothetical protein